MAIFKKNCSYFHNLLDMILKVYCFEVLNTTCSKLNIRLLIKLA